MYWVVDTTSQQLQFQSMIFLSWKGRSPYIGDCYTASYVFFPTFLPMQATSPLSDKIPKIRVHSNMRSLQTASKYSRLWIALRLYLSNEVYCYHFNMATHIHAHKPQMPISAQQWRLAVGSANASRSLRPQVTGQPKMKLTKWNILLFMLTVLLGAILLSGEGGRGTGERSE